MTRLRVAVIGAGAAGLCALRHLTARADMFDAQGFEQLDGVGGTWRYTDTVGTYSNGLPVQSSMYKNLKTNLPKEVMAFPGFPISDHLPSFIGHSDVLDYLQSYHDHYKLGQVIKLNTTIDKVEVDTSGEQTLWNVTYTTANQSTTSQFDAVIVCNGHYSIPLIPELDGAEEFKGEIIHSHDYRVPDAYKDKIVVCLGAAASGQDVSLDIATRAKKVIISHNKPSLTTVLPSNVFQKPGIERLTPTSIVFKNGDIEECNALMLCTGYRYCFPFLSPDCQVQIDNERVTPLYKHIIHTQHPTLSFIGICKVICPFPQFDRQVLFVLATLDGTFPLPSTADMDQDAQHDYESRLSEGMPHRYAHTMGPKQWQYNDHLSALANIDPLPKAVKNLYDEVHHTRRRDLPNYKKKQYKITDDETFEEVIES